MLNKECTGYIEKNLERKLTDVEIKVIEKHMTRFNLKSVCAWYYDWEDFCSDWCDEVGYTRKEARELLHGGIGEFKMITSIGILRFAS